MKDIIREPSTWGGFGLIATGIASVLAKDYVTGFVQIATGLVAVFEREKTVK